MNKSIMIAVEDRETNDVFLATSVVAEYEWNYSLIDGTDILCSFLTIGRELCFPLDIDLSAFLSFVYNNAESVILTFISPILIVSLSLKFCKLL